jgi:Spy/CpxP family protein refolding chaperone
MKELLSKRMAAALVLAAGSFAANAVAAEMAGGQAVRPVETAECSRLDGAENRESYGDVVLRQAEALKLTDEQIGRIFRIHQDNQRKVADLARGLRESRDSAYGLFLNPGADELAVRKVARDHTATFEALVETALKSRADIDAILTPDQRGQFKTSTGAPKP